MRIALAAPETGVIAAGGVFEIIVEDARLAVAKHNLYVRRPPLNHGVLLLNHKTRTPFGVAVVHDPITHL
jgi:hypothetical protein